jgi:hypothetical protein
MEIKFSNNDLLPAHADFENTIKITFFHASFILAISAMML